MFSFKCSTCGEVHEGMPYFGGQVPPLSYAVVPMFQEETRCKLGTDSCITYGDPDATSDDEIDETTYSIRGRLEIPVIGETEPFTWGVWVSLSEADYQEWADCYEADERSHVGPFSGRLDTALAFHGNTYEMRATVHLRDGGALPYIELQSRFHPLAVEQRNGITVERVAELYSLVRHR